MTTPPCCGAVGRERSCCFLPLPPLGLCWGAGEAARSGGCSEAFGRSRAAFSSVVRAASCCWVPASSTFSPLSSSCSELWTCSECRTHQNYALLSKTRFPQFH